jgi:hypothetical protein
MQDLPGRNGAQLPHKSTGRRGAVVASPGPVLVSRIGLLCGSIAGMTHWHIIQLMKDAVLMAAIVAAIVIIYRKLKGVG